MVDQLREEELQVIRDLREGDELTFEEIGERLGVDTSTACRVYTEPGRSFADLTVIRMRKHIARILEERSDDSAKQPKRGKRVSA
jgi:transcriptional regulator with XRE-family HTH domain